MQGKHKSIVHEKAVIGIYGSPMILRRETCCFSVAQNKTQISARIEQEWFCLPTNHDKKSFFIMQSCVVWSMNAMQDKHKSIFGKEWAVIMIYGSPMMLKKEKG